jgi:hypothetical protein
MKKAANKRKKLPRVQKAFLASCESRSPIPRAPDSPLPTTAVSKRVAFWGYLIALISVTGAAAWLRVSHLDDLMRYDEAYTFLHFGYPGLPKGWLDYHEPNNHVLHTLLVRLFAYFGGFDPATIRLPAFFSGLAIVPAGGYLAQRLTGRRSAALLAAMLLATSSLLIEYSVNARGYSMVCLASLLMGICTVEICSDFSRMRFWVAWSAIAVLGTFTIPVMLYPIAIFTCIILLEIMLSPRDKKTKRGALRNLAFALGIFALATVLLYLPLAVVNGVHRLVGNRYVSPHPLQEVLTRLPGNVLTVLTDWSRDTSWLWQALVFLGIAASLIWGMTHRRIFWTLPLIGTLFFLSAAIVQRVVPFPRVWMFMLPLMLVAGACGLDHLTTTFRNRNALLWGPPIMSVLVATAAMHSAWHTYHRPFLVSEDDKTLVDVKAISHDIAALCDGKTGVIAKTPAQFPLSYYRTFYYPKKVPSYRSKECERALVVVGEGQTVDEVMAFHHGFAESFYPLTVWKTYPHATVYLAPRQQASR